MGRPLSGRVRHALAAGAAVLMAAGGAEAQTAHLRGGVELLALNVTVRDNRGQPVSSLDVDDFEVLEDGRAQALAHFSRQRVPLLLTVLLDSSDSMAAHLDDAKDAARELLGLLQAGDFGAVVDSSGAVRQSPTPDVDVLKRALSAVTAGGTTFLYDAMWRAAELMSAHQATGAQSQPLLVVISDGGDTSSARPLDAALAALRSSGTAVYAIPPDRPALRARGRIGRHLERERRQVLKHITDATGGVVIADARRRPEDAIIRSRVAHELLSMYLLAYSPETPPPPDAQVIVRLKKRGMRVVASRPFASAARSSSP